MFRGYGRTLDIVLLLVLLVLSVAVLAMFALPELPTKPVIEATATFTPSPTLTPSAIMGPLPTLRPTLTPSPTSTYVPEPPSVPTPVATWTPVATAAPGSTPTPLPLISVSEVLPHDALFIRRHNDLSLPSTADQRALAGQSFALGDTDVQFERVQTLDGIRIASPSGSDALAIRYGLTVIPLVRRRDARATHYLEIALKAAQRQPATEVPSANYVFVVDTSGSMSGAKLNGVISGLRTLYSAMLPQDSIGIVDFDVEARTVLPATEVADLTPEALNAALRRLVAAGGTDIGLGLEAGIVEAKSFADPSTVTHIFLFSDGNPTNGLLEWVQIRAAIVSAVYDTRIRVSTFAIGVDANGRELDALAGVTGGTYTQVSDLTTLGARLTDELARRENLVAKDMRIIVEIDPTVLVLHLFGYDQAAEPIARAALGPGIGAGAAPAFATQVDGLQFYVPDLASGEAYWVVFEINIPESQGLDIGRATVSYIDAGSGQLMRNAVTLSQGRFASKLPPSLVTQHALSLWSSDVAYYALDDLAQDDFVTASARLSEHVSALDSAYSILSDAWLFGDLETMRNSARLAEALNSGTLGTRAAAQAHDLLKSALEVFAPARAGYAPRAAPVMP